jgi:hypothetical protein
MVKTELAEAFAVSKELISHGVITHKYLWTLFPPGELVYAPLGDADRLFIVDSSYPGMYSRRRQCRYDLNCLYVDYDGYNFGTAHQQLFIFDFKGTKKIIELPLYPARFLPDFNPVQKRCIERGRKFASLGGIQYKAYRDQKDDTRQDDDDKGGDWAPETKPQLDRRIILDARGHPNQRAVGFIGKKDTAANIRLSTGLISQAPVDATPPGGHQPLPAPGVVPVPQPMHQYPPGFHPNMPPPPPRRYDDGEFIDINPSRRPGGAPPMPPPPPPGRRVAHLRHRQTVEPENSGTYPLPGGLPIDAVLLTLAPCRLRI